MGAPLPDGEGDTWDGNGGGGGQSEEAVGGGGQREPEVDGGAGLLPSLPLQPWRLFLLSLWLPSLTSDRTCRWRAGEAGG